MNDKAGKKCRHSVLLPVIIVVGIVMRLRGIHNPLLDDQAWRQADTASMALHMENHLWDFPDVLFPKLSYDGVIPQVVELELPLFPYLLAWTWYFLGQADIWGRLWAVVFSSLSIGGIYVLGKKLFSRRVGIAAALVYAIVPLSVYYGRVIMPEPLTQMLAIWSLNAVLWYRSKPRVSRLVIAALVCALAILTKLPQAMILPVAIIFGFGNVQRRPRHTLTSAIIYSALALAIPAGYYLSVHHMSSSAGQFVSGIVSQQVVHGTAQWGPLLINLKNGLSIPILLLIVWGLVRLIKNFINHSKLTRGHPNSVKAYELGLMVWLLIAFIYVVTVCARIPLDYYLYPVVPPAALLIGLLTPDWPSPKAFVILAALIILVVYAGNGTLTEKLRWDERYLVQARWIERNTPENSVLVLSDPPPMTFYYSRRVGFRLIGTDEHCWNMLGEIPGEFLVKLPDTRRSAEFWEAVERTYPEIGPGVYQLLAEKLVDKVDRP